MTYQLDIPNEELQVFQNFLQIYSKGKIIVQEGHSHDQRIFLLRQGEVEVIKRVGEDRQVLGRIEAVNFFGEMAIVSHRPRTATVVAASEPVVVYAFDNPNLSAIMSNPKWGLMLMRRLADDLEQRHNEYESAQLKIIKVQEQISEMLGTILNLYAVSGSDEIARQMFLEALPKIIKVHVNELNIRLRMPDETRLKQYRRLDIISEQLYRAALITRSKLKQD